jgi:hypothetical protein
MHKKAIISYRLFFGTIGLATVITQAIYTAQNSVFDPVNFLSYFTNLSNIVSSVILLISTAYLLKSRKPSMADDTIRGGAVLYMAVTGIIYATLLSGEDLGLLLPWVNLVLHTVMPLVIVADWLYQPPRTKLGSRQTLLWLLFPAAYLVYSLVRGATVHWYPYPFLNPDKVGGYAGVAAYCIGILIVFFGLSWLLAKLGNKLPRRVN